MTATPTAPGQEVPWPTTEHDALREIVRDAYGLHAPIAEVVCYGKRKDSPVIITLDDGTTIRAEAGDYLRPSDLARTVAQFTAGQSTPTQLKHDDLRAAFTALMALANFKKTDDEVAEVHEWVQRFLFATGGVVHDVDLLDGDQAYEILGELQGARYSPHAGGLGMVLRDTSSGELHLRVSDLVAYVREVIHVKPLSAATLNMRMAEAGYEHRVLQQWKPGADRKTYRKRKVSTYVVSPETEGTS